MQKRNHPPLLNCQGLASVFCWSGISRGTLAAILFFGVNLHSQGAQNTQKKPDPIFSAAKKALAEGKLGKMPATDFALAKKGFIDCPRDGLILVGLELGLGNVGKSTEMIYALRPIYRNEQGNHVFFQEFGCFKDKKLPNSKVVKSKVSRVMQLKAKPGYAVGEIYLKLSNGINALSLTYMSISGQNLDPAQQYSSQWYGDPSVGKEVILGGNGWPLIGVFGNQNDHQVLTLGVFYIDHSLFSTNPVNSPPGESETTKTSGPIPEYIPTPEPRIGREITFLVMGSQKSVSESAIGENQPQPLLKTDDTAGKSESKKTKESSPNELEAQSQEGEDVNKIVLICGLLTVSGMSFLVILFRRRKKRKPHDPISGNPKPLLETNGVASQPMASRPAPARLPSLPKSQAIGGNSLR